MPGCEGSRCLTRKEQVASYSWTLGMTAATATMLRAAVLLRRMSLSRWLPSISGRVQEGTRRRFPESQNVQLLGCVCKAW
jgi:hypothetical protein